MKVVKTFLAVAMVAFLLHLPSIASSRPEVKIFLPLVVDNYSGCVVRDTFTDDNGVLLPDHAAWTTFRGTIDIQDNEANTTEVIGPWVKTAAAVIETGTSDGRVSIDAKTIGFGGHSAVGLVFRYEDPTHYWHWGINPAAGTAHLGHWNPDWTEVLVVDEGFQYGETYNLVVEMRGDRIDVYVDGVWHGGVNDSLFQTATKHGFMGETLVGHRFDNFEVIVRR